MISFVSSAYVHRQVSLVSCMLGLAYDNDAWMKPLFKFSIRYFLRTSSSSLLMLYSGPDGG